MTSVGGVLIATGLVAGQVGGVAQAAPAGAGSGSLASFGSTPLASISTPALGGDNNPYGMAVVPISAGKLTAGNVLVVNFNHGVNAGTGGTVVQLDPNTGFSSIFASGLPIVGPVGITINPASDEVWIGNFGATDGTTSNNLMLSPDGTVNANYNRTSVASTTSTYTGAVPTFDGVWGAGVSQIPGQVSFYFSTTGSGTGCSGGGEVWRIDPHAAGPANGQPINSTYARVAAGLADNATANGGTVKSLPVTAANAVGPEGFAYNKATGVLYVSNGADNSITAIPGAATATGPVVTTKIPVATGVLNLPNNLALNPATGGLLVANAGNNTLLELDTTTGAVKGSLVLDTGASGALFGLAATTDAQGRLVVFYDNDNSNTVNVVRTTTSGFTATPARLLDTRSGVSVPQRQLQGSVTFTLPATVPIGATAVLTVTATGSAGSGNVQVSTSASPPTTASSNVNFDPGSTAPNSVLVSVPADRLVTMTVGGSAVDVVVDLAGFLPASAITAVPASRIGDSRTGTGFALGRVSGIQTLTLPASVPTSAGLVALTVTATQASGGGNVVVYSGSALPATSNVNFTPGRTQANLVLVKPTNGTVSFQVNGGPTDLLVDVGGYTPAGSVFTAVAPSRVADSRTGIGLPQGLIQGAVNVTLPSVVPSGATAVLLNVTATGAPGQGFVAAYPAGQPQPRTSNVNYDNGVAGANLVLVPVDANNTVTLFVGGVGANLVLDVSAYVTS